MDLGTKLKLTFFHCRQNNRQTTGLIFSLVALTFFTPLLAADRSEPIISRKDRLELTEFYTNLVQQKLRSDLRLNGISDRDAAVTIGLDFDEKRLSADAATWYKFQENKQKKLRDEQDKSVKQSIKELLATATATKVQKREKEAEQPKEEQEVKSGTRIGRLNIDINGSLISKLLEPDKEEKPQGEQTSESVSPVTLAISIPSQTSMPFEPFVFKAADYIVKITVAIVLPDNVTKSFENSVAGEIAKFLDLQSLSKGAKVTDWVKVSKAPAVEKPPVPEPEQASPKTFAENIWRHDNSFLGTLLSGLVIGLFLLISMLVASLAVSKGIKSAVSDLGKDIAALKPAESKEEKSDAPSEAIAKDDQDGESETDHKYDSSAKSHAITHEMGTIREQVKVLVHESPFITAEYLRDMFYTAEGLSSLRDLITFVGYTPLKPAFEQLPATALERLKGYIDENRENQPNLLNGAEIGQKLYSDCIAKVTLQSDESKLYDPVRAELIKTEDVIVAKFVSEATAEEISVLIKTMTVERGNKLMKGIPSDKLKLAAESLDKVLANPDQVIASIVTKLQSISGSFKEKSQSQRRLILRLARSVGVADEEMVYGLIPAEDWDLKRQIIKQRIFLKDAVYVPAKVLSSAFGSLPLATRAELILTVDEALKKALLSSLGEGSKKSEMLQTEVEQLAKNAKKMEELPSKKADLLESLAAAIRRYVTENSVIDQILIAQGRALNITLPPELEAKVKSSQAAA